MDGLARLGAGGWKVAIVTNGTADDQLGKIQRTGPAEAVDAYALSGTEGVRKPDVGLFEIAARRCGMALTGRGWMVGDHLVKDIGGGRAAGLRTVWTEGHGRIRSTRRTTSSRTCSRRWRTCTASADRGTTPQLAEERCTAVPYSNTVLRDHIPPNRIYRLTRA
ncbi:HAD family hydrolase [Streptosporangium sp. CA-135522]|uniref:HAD family hydrolase n=1 Tax=Streptosporangium sp. CA-135522 TaxID=3240072 RepID=UPI003D9166FC